MSENAWKNKKQEEMEQVQGNERKEETEVKGLNLQEESSINKDERLSPPVSPTTGDVNGWPTEPQEW